MLVIGTNHALERVDASSEQIVPLVPVGIRARRSGRRAPAHQLGTNPLDARGIRTQPIDRQAMSVGEELIDLLLTVHAEIIAGGAGVVQLASFDKSATRFIAACSCASRPRRFARSAGSSALTITDSKNASTGSRSAASERSEPV